jgi:hypothetical protein
MKFSPQILLDPGTAIGLGAGGSLLGSILGASGASKQAKATNAAGQQALETQRGQNEDQMAAYLRRMLGGQTALSELQASLPQDRLAGMLGTGNSMTPQEQARLAEIDRELEALPRVYSSSGNPSGGGVAAIRRQGRQASSQDGRRTQLEAEKATLMGKGSPGRLSRDSFTSDTSGGLLGEYGNLANTFQQEGQGILSGYDADTQRLIADALGLETQAKDFGKGESARIDRDAGRALEGANRQAIARFAGAGLGGSSLAGQASMGNARNIFEGAQDQKGALGDRQIGLLTGLGQNRLGLTANRLGGRTTLQSSLSDRNLGLQRDNLNLKANIFGGGILNPSLGNTTQYFPGASSGGTLAQGLGNSLSGAGGTALGFGLNQMNQQQLMQLLTQMQG